MHSGRRTLRPVKFYENQARDLIKDLREGKELTYEQLARRLLDQGETVETRVLINKINRGKFSFAFALQVLAAMDVKSVKLPRAWNEGGVAPARTVGWVSEKAPKTATNETSRRSTPKSSKRAHCRSTRRDGVPDREHLEGRLKGIDRQSGGPWGLFLHEGRPGC